MALYASLTVLFSIHYYKGYTSYQLAVYIQDSQTLVQSTISHIVDRTLELGQFYYHCVQLHVMLNDNCMIIWTSDCYVLLVYYTTVESGIKQLN